MWTFLPYFGDTDQLKTTEKSIVFKWIRDDCKILFSAVKHGKALNCHFTSDKAGLRKLEQAINEWCKFCFWLWPWCEMIIGIIEKPSICRLAEKCKFKKIAEYKGKSIYIREK